MMRNRILLCILYGFHLANAQTSTAKVMRIIDGDTIIAEIDGKQERIRLKCIDAPELRQTFTNFNDSTKTIGIEAKKQLESLLQIRDVIELKCSILKDKFTRYTCRITKNDTNINLEMVKNGFAYANTNHCFTQIDAVYYLYHQYKAMYLQIGLWQHGSWEAPWKWRNNAK